MTNDRSSSDAFLLFSTQLMHQSSIVRISGHTGKVEMFEMLGRIVGVRSDALRLRGRGCDLMLDLSGATFECVVPRELPFVSMRTTDKDWIFRPLWEIAWPRGGKVFIGETVVSDPLKVPSS
jgi:hypothetical protein